jgi:hypothetical protein
MTIEKQIFVKGSINYQYYETHTRNPWSYKTYMRTEYSTILGADMRCVGARSVVSLSEHSLILTVALL